MFQSFGVDFPIRQINPSLFPLEFSSSFSEAEACQVELANNKGGLLDKLEYTVYRL